MVLMDPFASLRSAIPLVSSFWYFSEQKSIIAGLILQGSCHLLEIFQPKPKLFFNKNEKIMVIHKNWLYEPVMAIQAE